MGTAIIINGADYSENNIGQVTFATDPKDVATNVATVYCTSIGDNSVYDAVYEMVYSLASEGLWNKMIGIYPMLGSTNAAVSKNLVNPGTFDLVWGDRIKGPEDTGGAHNKLYAGTGTDSNPGTQITIDLPIEKGFFAFNVVSCGEASSGTYDNYDRMGTLNAGSPATVQMKYCTPCQSASVEDIGLGGDYSIRQLQTDVIETYVNTPYAMSLNTIYATSFWSKDRDFGVTLDNINFAESTTMTAAVLTTLTITNRVILGKKTTHYMKVYGNLTKAEGQIAYPLFKAFLKDVKGLTIYESQNS